MATSTIQSLRELQTSLNNAIDSYVEIVERGTADDSRPSADARKDVSDAASKIISAVGDPFGDIIGLGLQPTQNLAIRIAIDLDLFILIQDDITLDELVGKTKADKVLLLRILRLLVSTSVFLEPSRHTYSSTRVSQTLRIPSIRDWIKTCFDTLEPIWLQTPAFLRKNGYHDIINLSNNPTLSMYGSNFFEQLAADPQRETDFASAMKLQELAPKTVVPQFSYSEGITSFRADRKTADDIFFVDVGGGQGQYLGRLIEEHPELPGRKVLQDLPSVVAGVDKSAIPFEPMAYDIFTPQPIKGAKYYHLRGVLEDWPDKSCIKILSQLQLAFTPRYSRLLVQGYVLPETGCPTTEAMLDLNMWTCCGMQRSESQWHELLRKSGFEVLRIIRAEVGLLGMIEARMVDYGERANL